MKKNIVYAFALSLVLLLSGCGGNSIQDVEKVQDTPTNPTTPTAPVVDGDFSFFNVPSSVVISDAAKEYPVKLQLINAEKKGVPGKNIEILAFDNRFGEMRDMRVKTDVNGFANFVYISPNDLVDINGQTLPLTVVFDENGTRVDSANIILSFNASTTTPNSFNLINATSITVTAASETKDITVVLVDSSEVGVADQTVEATTLPSAFGSLSPASVKTDRAGRATFQYTAPLDLSSVDGQSQNVSLLFTDENSHTVTATATITIESAIIGGATYSLVNETTPVTITHANQVETISVNVVDASNVGVAGKSVTLSNPNFGALTSSTAVTNAAGLAEFSYAAPSNLTGLVTTAMTLSFRENGTTITKNVTVNVNATSAISDYTLSNENGITINFATQSKEIAVQVTKNGAPVAGESVTAKSIPAAFGRIENATVTTGTDGYARFTYIAADTLTDGTQPLELVHTDSTGVESAVSVDINVLAQAQPLNFSLINETADINITRKDQVEIISVYVVNTTNVGVAGKTVSISTIANGSGSVSAATVITDASGKAEFTYQAPNNIAGLSTTNATLSFEENGVTITKAVSIIFNEQVVITPYDFMNESNITIEHAGTQIDLKAQLTFNGIPVAGKEIKMTAFDASKGSISNGYTVTTDSGGYVTFFYVAPASLDDVNGTTLVLAIQFDEDSVHIESNITVNFNETTDSVEGNVSLPIVVIPTLQREIILESNSKTVEIAISVFKDISPYTQGSVKVELPNKVLNGVDVGQFTSYEVDVNPQGVATFSYTGPSNLQALISNDDNDSIFKFYHIENTTDKQNMKVIYQLPADPHVSRNYEISIVTSGDFSMGIPDKEKTFNVLLKAKDSAGNEVAFTDENITKVTALTTNSTVAQILDTATGTLVNSLELNTINNSPFILKSKKLSGLVPVEVNIEFIDANGAPQSLSTIVNVRVFSGPPSAISISYVSTGQDVDRAKYIEKMAISVTDEYGNRVNTQPNITLGAIVGYAVDGSEASSAETNVSKRLFYGRDDIVSNNANGEIKELGDNNVSTTNFEDNTASRTDVFRYVNAEGNNTDKLVIFGAGKHYEAMGKWDMSLGGDNHTLTLQDNYFGIDRSELYYAVGHNYYQDQCRQDGREWVGSTDAETYKLDVEGTVVIDYKYDYHLGGKDALIWVNLDGLQPDTGEITRIGEANKAPLRTAGLVAVPSDGYTLPKGTRGHVEFEIWHENAPERYRNANFGYAVKAGSTCAVLAVRRSGVFDARTCNNTQSIIYDHDNNASTPDVVVGTAGNNHGGAYVSFYLQAPLDKDCSFAIDRIVVSSEF